MTPVAGVTLSLIGCLLLAGNLREPKKGTVSLEELPSTSSIICLHDAPQIYISLNKSGHLSFAASEPRLQATVLEQVSREHHINFSELQLANLQRLPFLATTVEQLSGSLSLAKPTATTTQSIYSLTEAQLAECAKTARLIAPTVLGRPVSFSLLISAETDSPKVMKLVALLQAQGINRFTLQTRS